MLARSSVCAVRFARTRILIGLSTKKNHREMARARNLKTGLRLEHFKFALYLCGPIAVGLYFSSPEMWAETVRKYAPLETHEQRMQRLEQKRLELREAREQQQQHHDQDQDLEHSARVHEQD
jgi:Pet100